jgi:hypothetical protein
MEFTQSILDLCLIVGLLLALFEQDCALGWLPANVIPRLHLERRLGSGLFLHQSLVILHLGLRAILNTQRGIVGFAGLGADIIVLLVQHGCLTRYLLRRRFLYH